jgi:hypothetical protein
LLGWQKAQADAKKLEEQGFGGLIAAPPELDEWAERARHCWAFCGGWQPERWSVYAAFYPVPDWHQLIELMQTIRQNV